MKKKVLSLIFVMLICFSMETPAFAKACIQPYDEEEYYTAEGILVEKISFVENGEYAAVIKRTYKDGTFDVEVVNGDHSTFYQGKVSLHDAEALLGKNAINDEYPKESPYWYAGYDDYSQNGSALTASVISGLLVAYTGAPPSVAYSVATTIYSMLGGNIYSNVYFRTYRYYSTVEEAPDFVTWNNKSVTYTYSDSARTKIISGPDTIIYNSLTPFL